MHALILGGGPKGFHNVYEFPKVSSLLSLKQERLHAPLTFFWLSGDLGLKGKQNILIFQHYLRSAWYSLRCATGPPAAVCEHRRTKSS